jgi:hypothetical protein
MYGHVLYFIFPAIGGAVHINSIGQFWPVLASFGARSVSLIIKKKTHFPVYVEEIMFSGMILF